MTPEIFVYWLDGFLRKDAALLEEEVRILREQLASVLDKMRHPTPKEPFAIRNPFPSERKDLIEEIPNIWIEDGSGPPIEISENNLPERERHHPFLQKNIIS